MLESLTSSLVQIIQSNVWLAPLAALVGGMLTAANPCVLASIPLMMAYVAGQEGRPGVARSFLLSLTFAVGLTITFSIMFLTTWAASSILRANWWLYIAAAVCLLMGLHLLDILHIKIPVPAGVRPSRKGLIGALLLGMLFGLVSLPCAGPILLVLLSIIPLKGAAFGGTLLVAYSLGHCVLILVGGMSMGLVETLVASKGLQQANLWSKRIAGVLVMGVGVFLLIS
ncbi:MAG: cytochrome c biogenesis protein CcdA [Phycisphaerae bacterium]|jgi:cytochrome c biogenesis protein CcdA